LSVTQALRWGQVRGLRGSQALALAVAATRLGRSVGDEDFWVSVVHFLVNHPELDVTHVGSIVDYLHHQRFVPEQVRAPEGPWVALSPPQPDLGMKGRTPASLLRQVAEWHKRLKLPPRYAALRWKPSGFAEYRAVEPQPDGRTRCWTIQELLTSEAL